MFSEWNSYGGICNLDVDERVISTDEKTTRDLSIPQAPRGYSSRRGLLRFWFNILPQIQRNHANFQ